MPDKKNKLQFFQKIAANIAKNPFWKSRYNSIMILNSLLLNLGIWLFLYLRIKPSEYLVPIHFNVYFGIDVIDKWTKVFVIPKIGVIVVLINLILAYFIFPHEKFISYFLSSSSFFAQILLLLAAISVVAIR
jgi:hypothetical protein